MPARLPYLNEVLHHVHTLLCIPSARRIIGGRSRAHVSRGLGTRYLVLIGQFSAAAMAPLQPNSNEWAFCASQFSQSKYKNELQPTAGSPLKFLVKVLGCMRTVTALSELSLLLWYDRMGTVTSAFAGGSLIASRSAAVRSLLPSSPLFLFYFAPLPTSAFLSPQLSFPSPCFGHIRAVLSLSFTFIFFIGLSFPLIWNFDLYSRSRSIGR